MVPSVAIVAVGVIAIALLGGFTVTRMLRDPDDVRYTDPYERRVSSFAFVYPVVPFIVLVSGHWVGAIILALFIPVMFWLGKVNQDYLRERRRQRR